MGGGAVLRSAFLFRSKTATHWFPGHMAKGTRILRVPPRGRPAGDDASRRGGEARPEALDEVVARQPRRPWLQSASFLLALALSGRLQSALRALSHL